MKLEEILRQSPYGLNCFDARLIERLEKSVIANGGKGGYRVECLIRRRPISLRPEEVVRQLFLMTLLEKYGYPHEQIQVEYPINFGGEKRPADVVVLDAHNPTVPYIVAEIKKPRRREGKAQLKSYCNASGAPIAVWTNGEEITGYHRRDPNFFEEIRDFPARSQTLADVLQMKWTLDDLIANDKLGAQNKSLKDIVQEMEDEVLANAGVDVFEEAFKLIFAKLYDEWLSGYDTGQQSERNLEFYNSGQTDEELWHKIQRLFDNAKEQWPGVFADDARIALSPSHLKICVSSLQSVKFFNSNLDIIDDAFEYLINKSARGEKGQFFTPRYVIDMCVKMLAPQADENLIDTAAGSAGFPVHAIFHVWRDLLRRKGKKVSYLFTIEQKPRECTDYAAKRIFAMDFDEKAVRVARTLNLIAGDGQSNVLHLNALDYPAWTQRAKDEDWQGVYMHGFRKLRKLRAVRNENRDFQFDVLMANPPFAGDIRESQIIHLFELGKKMQRQRAARGDARRPTAQKGWHEKISRHILFIERNLQFLRPGGRMAIVLPQGVFNNVTDYYVRDFIAARCRILAVIGLHTNTFKPHTGTKTSVLFVQKWNDDKNAGALCPRRDDYPIFFATMRKPGKNNSGDKVYVRGDGEYMRDANGHFIVEHDLFNLYAHHFPDGGDKQGRALDSPGIAEAFLEFAKKEGLSFVKKI